MALQDFVTAADLAVYSNGKISSADPRVNPALAGVSRAVRRYCGWHIGPSVSETLLLDGPGGRVLDLPSLNVADVASVTQNDTLLDPSSYRWSALGSIKLNTGWWTEDYRAISVVLTHGYDDFEDVQETVKAIVMRALMSPTGATREQAGQVSVSWAITAPGVSGGLAILEHERAALDSYRIVGV